MIAVIIMVTTVADARMMITSTALSPRASDEEGVTADAGKLIGDWLVDAADWLLVAGEELAEGVSVVEDADWSVVFSVDGADDVILQALSSDWSPQF